MNTFNKIRQKISPLEHRFGLAEANSTKEFLEHHFLGAFKSAIRGGAIGGLGGVVAGYVFGDGDVSRTILSAEYGAVLVGTLDLGQHAMRVLGFYVNALKTHPEKYYQHKQKLKDMHGFS